ncbi:hypothetical protein BGZ70_005644 [Mortierella alpina]|uniref:Uncharacterized protein n=1 Tax=Mortierella alpina TaxID=64518 RepID=A0A9P6JAY4_MORAP|nr:hypothetical protein BGZ70_005644 [Mortierella alpina]
MDLNWDEVDENKEKDMPDVETIIKEASIARFSLNPTAAKIKSLRLPSNRFGARNPLPLLLLKSDLLDLETCGIPCFRKDADPKEIEQVVRERCPNLKHLICPCFRGEREQDGAAVCAFIRGCSGLKSFTAELFSDYDAESFDPTYFNDDYSDLDPRHIIAEVRSHRKTLEVLDLTDCVQVFSEDQQDILNVCHQLKRFWVTDSYGEGSMVGIESTDVSASYWACSELRELGLVLNLYPKREDKFDVLKDGTEEDEDWDDYDLEELVVKGTKQVYTQIGKMEKLEVLALDIDRSYENHMKISDFAGNLTICDGYLDELARLKKLKSLQLRADFWSAMGQAEVEFMYKNWPLLSKITFNCKVSELRALPHWQWLLSKRPQLRLEGPRLDW